jgi:transcription antitermination factor NusG
VPSTTDSKRQKNSSSPPPPPSKWVVVQLSPLGEREKNPQLLTRVIQRTLGSVDVFIPAVSEQAREESHTSFYMEGYIFIKYSDNVNFMRLQEIPYFKSVICDPVARRKGLIPYSLLDDSALRPMRTGMEAMKVRMIKANDRVRVNKGQYKNLTGTVIQVRPDGEAILVNVGLVSKPMLIEFPSSYLDKSKT